MKKFQEPQIVVVSFDVEDIVTSSIDNENGDGGMSFIGDCL